VWADVRDTGLAIGRYLVGRLHWLRRLLGWVTPLGLVFLGVGLASWVLGLRLGWRELLVVAGSSLFAFGIAFLFTLGKLSATVGLDAHPRRVVVGESASAAITVANPSARRILPFRVDLVVGSGRAMFDIPSLGPGAEHEELMTIPTHRRSVITLGPARTVRSDPLSLVVRSAAWSTSLEVFVHPRTVALDSLGAGMLRDLEGRATNDVSPSDVEIHALRDYVPGDDRRHVHWRTSARTGKLMVRQFIDTRRSHLGLVVSENLSEYASEEEYELAVSVLASLGVRAVIDGIEVTIVGGQRTIPTASTQLLLDRVSGITSSPIGGTLVPSVQKLVREAQGLTLGVVLGGSRTSWDEWAAAAAQFDPDVRTVLIGCDIDGSSGFQSVGRALRITVCSLADLPRLLSAVVS
jgi:uncharacterized protein (DUF58 family)